MEKDQTLTWDRLGQLLVPMMLIGIRERDCLKGIYSCASSVGGWSGILETSLSSQTFLIAQVCEPRGSFILHCVSDSDVGFRLSGQNSRRRGT